MIKPFPIETVAKNLCVNCIQQKCAVGNMMGCFNPVLGQIWTNPTIGFKESVVYI